MMDIKFLLFTMLFVHGVCNAATVYEKDDAKPNIIIFLVDDLGWQDISAFPNFLKLVQSGVQFSEAYATPLCTPTRVSLITGTNAARHRVTNWTHPDKDRSTDYPDTIFQHVDWNINGLGIDKNEDNTFLATPLPLLLKENGYRTILAGKAHFGSKGIAAADPKNIGFDVNIAGSEIGHPASYFGSENFDRSRNGFHDRNAVRGLKQFHGQDIFLTEALTQSALAALGDAERQSQPFFLYLSHYAVHTPIMADPRYVNAFYGTSVDSVEAAYQSLVKGVDKSLGDVLDYLAKNNLSENTVFFFLSDNGGLSRVPPRGGISDTHNTPLRSGKGSVYEGGIRIPLVVKWPKVIQPQSVSENPIIVEDLFSTIRAIAGIENRKVVQTVDGINLLPYLQDADLIDSTRALVWHHPNRWIKEDFSSSSWASALRIGDWKLIYDYTKQTLELYNLDHDIGEKHNLTDIYPEKTKELAGLLTQKLKEREAQLPRFKGTERFVPWPNEIVNDVK
ncbi:sulfatase [Sphingobacterium sp. DN00404]|uniref:Sulfatase n=1 Tax=Sphingobacterium micropteri TaxID=2763501 RepID=A0ABR7YQU9_9SPHI|nr:sulfatase [Sphingobacterium micropteri]MBD1433706.1 sulfatase [Sphingobacterium micropteri]